VVVVLPTPPFWFAIAITRTIQPSPASITSHFVHYSDKSKDYAYCQNAPLGNTTNNSIVAFIHLDANVEKITF
jgi:hypothetical protein